MIYLAELSFDTNKKSANAMPRHGRLTALLDAASVDDAVTKLRRLLRKHARTGRVLDDADRVYLDALVEVPSMPKDGLLAYYESSYGEFQSAINVAVPEPSPTDCEAYAFGFNGHEEDMANGSFKRKPFITASRLKSRTTRMGARTRVV